MEKFDKEKELKRLQEDKNEFLNIKVDEAFEESLSKVDETKEIEKKEFDFNEEIIEEESNLDDAILKGIEHENKDEDEEEYETLTPVVKLRVPHAGIKEVKMDFNDLSASTLLRIEKMWEKNRTSRKFVPLKAMDTEYLGYIVSHCSGIKYSLLQQLNAGDYSRLTLKVQNFLLGV